MNQAIKFQYEIVFQNRILKLPGKPQEIDKLILSKYDCLARFLYEYSKVMDIEQYLLPALNTDEAESETVSVDILNGKVFFWDMLKKYTSNDKAEFTMPIEDLKIIVNDWKQFLTQEPQNGTKI